jgi:hypothetical protein
MNEENKGTFSSAILDNSSSSGPGVSQKSPVLPDYLFQFGGWELPTLRIAPRELHQHILNAL